eukprot:6467876-Amphidinium_carterae.4
MKSQTQLYIPYPMSTPQYLAGKASNDVALLIFFAAAVGEESKGISIVEGPMKGPKHVWALMKGFGMTESTTGAMSPY